MAIKRLQELRSNDTGTHFAAIVDVPVPGEPTRKLLIVRYPKESAQAFFRAAYFQGNPALSVIDAGSYTQRELKGKGGQYDRLLQGAKRFLSTHYSKLCDPKVERSRAGADVEFTGGRPGSLFRQSRLASV